MKMQGDRKDGDPLSAGLIHDTLLATHNVYGIDILTFAITPISPRSFIMCTLPRYMHVAQRFVLPLCRYRVFLYNTRYT